ncbi:MAG TPA: ImmA/IrrE family metallo-endopeptidase [Tepidisphaeraceae bacterium]
MATKQFIHWIERRAGELRRLQKLGALDVLNPFELAAAMGVTVIKPTEVQGLSRRCLSELAGAGADHWSAGAITLPDGRAVVAMNPGHAPTRQRATLMEELAHLHLGHQPSELLAVDGQVFRTFKKSQETQAYWVGAAALLPLAVLQHAQRAPEYRGGCSGEGVRR